MSPEERLAAHRWWEGVVKGRTCAVCGSKHNVQGHHILPKQDVKRAGGDVWAKANGLPLCESCHMNHESAAKRVPRRLIPVAAEWFARDLGLDWKLERIYPEDGGCATVPLRSRTNP